MNVKSKSFRVVFLLVVLLVGSFAQSAQVSAQAPKSTRLTLESLGNGDLSLRGLYGTAAIFIPFQSNWVISQDIQATVIYTASPILNRDHTTLTISANDQSV